MMVHMLLVHKSQYRHPAGPGTMMLSHLHHEAILLPQDLIVESIRISSALDPPHQKHICIPPACSIRMMRDHQHHCLDSRLRPVD